MKKILFGLSAFTMLFATSCQNDLDFDTTVEKTSTVSFSVGTPEIATRAYSDGTTATNLQYAVYDAAGNQLTDLTVTNGEIHGSTTVKLQLTTGNTYSVIFWAAAPDAPYTVDFGTKTMTVNYKDAVSNAENRDAFYKYHTFTVKGAQTETIELKRPFAQLNIGTADYAASTSAGYTPTKSAVVVKNVYSTLDLKTGVVDEEVKASFALADIKKNETFPVAGYEYLAMNYLLVGADKETVDIEFTYTDGSNDKTRTVGSVPVQRNYRTNIYGNLLTSSVDINVEIKPEYDGTHELDALHKAALNGGEVTLTEDVVLTQPIEVRGKMTINLNGRNINTEYAEGSTTNHIYAFHNYGDLTINGEGAINARGIFNYGTMTLEEGTINAIDGNGGYGVRNYEGAKFIMNGGTIATTLEDDNQVDKGGYDATPLRVDEGATAIINGGVLNNICDFTFAIENLGNTTINGGTFKSVHSTVANSGTMTIEGGSFSCDGLKDVSAHALYAEKGLTTINGGTFDGKDNNNGFNVYAQSGAEVIITGGIFQKVHSGSLYGEGKITVSGGKFFDKIPDNRLAAGFEAIDKNGTWYVVAEGVTVATTKEELAAAIQANSTILLGAGNYTFPASSFQDKEGVTLVCEEGTVFEGNSKLNINGATVIGATFSNPNGTAVDQTINGTFKDCTFTGANGLRYCYAGETVVFENCVFDGSTYGVHFDGGANDVIFRNCTISGFNALAGALTLVTFEGCTFKGNGKSGYNGANLWGSAKMINCEFTFDGTTKTEWIDCIGEDKTYEFTNCTVNGEKYTSDNFSTFEKIFSRNYVGIKINGIGCNL